MNWYKGMYLSGSVERDAARLMREMENGRFPDRVWVISIPVSSGDQLDIRKASSLAYHGLWEDIPMIAGLAGSKDEAVELVQRMVGDCLAKRGDALVRQFLTEQGKDRG